MNRDFQPEGAEIPNREVPKMNLPSNPLSFRARDARIIAESKGINLEGILTHLKNEAERGCISHAIPPSVFVSNEVIQGLMKLGYSVSMYTDPFNGLESYRVSW